MNEKEDLADQTRRLTKEEQDLTNQLLTVKQELEGVKKERDGVNSERQELLKVKAKQEEVEKLLRGELEEMGRVSFHILKSIFIVKTY